MRSEEGKRGEGAWGEGWDRSHKRLHLLYISTRKLDEPCEGGVWECP